MVGSKITFLTCDGVPELCQGRAEGQLGGDVGEWIAGGLVAAAGSNVLMQFN